MYSKLDFTVFLRGVSIFAIVAGHFNMFELAGGSFYLLFLAGFNFARFNYPKTKTKTNGEYVFNLDVFTSKYFGFIMRIIYPVLFYTIFVQLYLGQFHLASIFLYSNFIGPNYANGLSFWFIEVLIQIYVLFYFLMLSNMKYHWVERSPYKSYLYLYLFFYLISFLTRYFFDTSQYLDRLPHLLLYLFIGGVLVSYSISNKQKIITTFALLLISLDLLNFGCDDKVVFVLVFSIMTVWIKAITLPKFLVNFIDVVAMSSLFIYLIHFQAKSLLLKFIPSAEPFMSVAFAFLLGIIFAKIWKMRKVSMIYLFKVIRNN